VPEEVEKQLRQLFQKKIDSMRHNGRDQEVVIESEKQ
jgi:hypothetical protein